MSGYHIISFYTNIYCRCICALGGITKSVILSKRLRMKMYPSRDTNVAEKITIFLEIEPFPLETARKRKALAASFHENLSAHDIRSKASC